MHQTLIASAVFMCLIGAAFGALFISELFPPHYRHDDTYNIVRLAANLHDLAMKCESFFGKGLDLEWAFADGTLYLLQCRAMTRNR